MDYTKLTRKTFGSFAAALLAIELINVGYGLTDMAFIARFGLTYVAAIGVSDLVTLFFMSFFTGMVEVFALRLARQEGRGNGLSGLQQLAPIAFTVTALWSILAFLSSFLVSPLMDVIGTDYQVAQLADQYAFARLSGGLLTLLFALSSIALRIMGHRRLSVTIIAVGFIGNIVANYTVLYTPLSNIFTSPLQAVAVATMFIQAMMVCVGLGTLFHLAKHKNKAEESEEESLILFFKLSTSMGLRNMNNYAAAVVPFLLMSQLSVGTVAAASVAVRLWTLYCRVPQALIGSSSAFIGYAHGISQAEARATVRRVGVYVSVPSVAFAVFILACAPILAPFFGGQEIDRSQVWLLTAAYLVAVPFYIQEHLIAQTLAVEQQGAWISVASSAVTYLVSIPIATLGVVFFESALVAILSGATASLLLSLVYHRRFRRLGYTLRMLPMKEK